MLSQKKNFDAFKGMTQLNVFCHLFPDNMIHPDGGIFSGLQMKSRRETFQNGWNVFFYLFIYFFIF